MSQRLRRSARPVACLTTNGSMLLNPVLLYSSVWLAALIFLWLGLVNFMGPINPGFVKLVAGNICVSILAYSIVSFWTKGWASPRKPGSPVRAARQISSLSLHALQRCSDFLFVIWSVGSVVNIYASGGLPIVWILQGRTDRSYATYGLPTFTGLVAACGFFATLGFFILRLAHTRKRRMWAIVLVLGYQVAILSRGGAMLMLLELIGIYLQFGRMGLRRIVAGVLVLFLVISVFGVMGDVRAGKEVGDFLSSLRTDRGAAVFKPLPSGFFWTYLYASIGSVNLNAAIDDYVPLGRPYWSIAGLFPTVIRTHIYTEQTYEARYPLPMVNAAFNVFTFYGGYIADFGIPGCLAVTFLLQLVASYCYVKARQGGLAAVIAFSVCFQVIAVSLFTDMLTSWVILFQLFLALLFSYFEKAKLSLETDENQRSYRGALVRKKRPAGAGIKRRPTGGLEEPALRRDRWQAVPAPCR